MSVPRMLVGTGRIRERRADGAGRRRTRIRSIAIGVDWVLVAAASVLSALGCVLVWSATAWRDGGGAGRRQVLSLMVAVALAFIVTRMEARSLRAYALPIYLGSVVLLLLPLTPMGVSIAGARAWAAIPGGFTLQPSEPAKLALILLVASVLAGNRARGAPPTDRDVVKALAAAALPIVIVLVQNDTGTAMVMAGIVAALLLVSGVGAKWLLGLAGVGTVGVALVVSLGLLAEYQLARLTSFLDPAADPLGAGHNTAQARIAIGDGGLFGRGLFAGSQTQGGFVPVNDSDFIFTVGAEELGFVAGAGLIALIGVICWRGLRIAWDAVDLFGRLVAAGVISWFAFQSFENIGMALGVMPVTGVTLPFVSYGGSSMIAAWLGIGLLQLVRLTLGRSG